MKIYVASSWRNKYQPGVVDVLRIAEHDVYDFRNPAPDSPGFKWSDLDGNWEIWNTTDYIKALQHPVAQEGFDSDFDAMIDANICVLVLPCGRSAHLEAGYFCGKAGKKLVIYIPFPEIIEPELMYKMADLVTDDIDAVLRFCQRAFLLEEPNNAC